MSIDTIFRHSEFISETHIKALNQVQHDDFAGLYL